MRVESGDMEGLEIYLPRILFEENAPLDVSVNWKGKWDLKTRGPTQENQWNKFLE